MAARFRELPTGGRCRNRVAETRGDARTTDGDVGAPRLAVVWALVLAGLLVQGCSREPMGEIMVYSGLDEALVEPLLQTYRGKGLEVAVEYGDSAALARRILAAEDGASCDVFLSEGIGAMAKLDAAGVLASVGPAAFQSVPVRCRAASGNFVGVSGRLRVVGYNTQALKPGDVPTALRAFTGPDWKGRVGWAPAESAFEAFVSAMRATKGEVATMAWLDAMVSNEVRAFADEAQAVEACAKGEVDIVLVDHVAVERAVTSAERVVPVAARFIDDEGQGSFLNLACAATLKGSGLERESRIFLGFLLDDTTQGFFVEGTFGFPVKKKVKPFGELPKLEKLATAAVGFDELEDVTEVRALLRKMGVL